MSRLIDADELIRKITEIESENGGIGIYFTQIIDLVKEQPTSYDTDKVMEQLKGLHEGYKCTDNEFQRGAKAGAHYVLNRAIEIVKGGGVNG